MQLNKLTAAIILSVAGLPSLACAANVTGNDDTNSFSGLDAWMMISKDNGYSWQAYTDSKQNNFPGTVVGLVAQKDELAIISHPYDPNRTYRGGEKVRFLGYYWTAQWWVDKGISPSTDPVWKKGDKADLNMYAEFYFTPYSGQKAKDLQATEKAKVAAQRKVIGYFPEWGIYDAHNNFTPDKIDYAGLTHVNYGFAVIKDGRVVTHDTERGPDLMRDLDQRTEMAGVTHMISIGGWTNSAEGVFEAATATDASTETLADSMVSYMRTWRFDGIDVDWEYPDSDAEKAQFTRLIQKLRSKLDAAGLQDDKYYQLSIAATTNHKNIKYINPEVTVPLLDSVNVMAYDMHGAFDPITGHNAPLFANSKDADPKLNSSSAMMEYANTWKVPKAKLMMGIPYYGRGWGNVAPTEVVKGLPGFMVSGTATVKGAWDDAGQFTGTNPWYVLKEKLASGEYKRYWDAESHVPYLYGTYNRQFLSYDDPQSVKDKVNHILLKDYGGAIIWDLSGDTPEHELGHIVDDLIGTPIPNPGYGLKATLFADPYWIYVSQDIKEDMPCLTNVYPMVDYSASNMASSVNVPLNSLGVVLYDECDYKGTKLAAPSSIAVIPYNMNKKTSSVKVIKAIAYADENFSGANLVVEGDMPALSGSVNFNDVMSSIKVADGYTVRLYPNANYSGQYVDVKSGENVPKLSALVINNAVSSIKVFKN
ncbi:glycosyl hydrolase family 18 protein [Enterobacter sp.]|jgi:chitinase|uniref:glycosyl hydrolase family 18 protein n=1 Tax=Enterobacter sp. TaxID=42895 RepID=UPI00296E6016|nr:glycosyl hydrolase family 18 protein [Enterobacter sp.]